MSGEDRSRRKFRDLVESAEEVEARRYLDVCVVWERAKTGETLWSAGGQWDRVEQRYTGRSAGAGKIIKLRESQIESARWAAWWMQERAAGRDRDFFGLFMLSDRGAGKTHFGAILIVTLAVQFPRLGNSPSICWLVSSSHADREELDREIRDHFPRQWFHYREWPKHEYHFAWGPRATHVSAAKIDSLKKGRVDFILINEAQKMPKKAPAFALGRIKDKGGLAAFAANPPTEMRGKWILDWEEKFRERNATDAPYPIRFVKLISALNDTLDAHVGDQVAEVIRDLDPRLAAADIDGLLLRPGQAAYWEWNKIRNLRSAPLLGDVTEEITRKRTGRAYRFLGGADFQATPHMAASIWRIFRDEKTKQEILWCVDDFVCDQSDEDELLTAVEDAGYAAGDILWIGDASGQWQDGKHSKNGRDSFAVFRQRRHHIIPPTKPRDPKHHPKNPPVEQRVKLVNKLLREERFFVEPDCTKMAQSLKECELRQGRYSSVPSGFYAHLSDTAGYAAWWLSPMPSAPRKMPIPSIEVGTITRRQVW